MIRLAVEGDLVVADPQRRLAGRGAYVCDHTCAEEAVKRRAMQRAFRRPISIDPDFLHSFI
ncbi:MAG: YlxR family protein [Patulibacter sp.]|nr:YlxR family protein [Patulibacter sp.]